MHAGKALGLASFLGVALVGGCQVIAGIPSDTIRDETISGGGNNASSSSSSSGGGQPCTDGQQCASQQCNNGFCCENPPMETICADACGSKDLPCGGTIECGCQPPNLCGGAGVATECGCVACARWNKVYGDSTSGLIGSDFAIDINSEIILGGDFFASINFGGGTINGAGEGDAFLAKIDANGDYGGWAKTFGNNGKTTESVTKIAISAQQYIFVTGTFTTMVNLGGTDLSAPNGPWTFLGKFDPDGNHIWSTAFGGTSGFSTVPIDIAVDDTGSGSVCVTGNFRQDLTIGGTMLSGPGDQDVFVACFDMQSGMVQYAKAFPHVGDQYATGLTASGNGGVILSGFFINGIDFGGSIGVKTSQGGSDGFLAKLNSAGDVVFAKTFGDASEQIIYDVAVDSVPNIVVTGAFQGTIDFGGATGPITSATVDNAFLAKLDPNGDGLWSKSFGGAELARGRSLSVTQSNDTLLIGDGGGVLDFGGGPRNVFWPGVFMARFDPTGAHVWSKGFTFQQYQGAAYGVRYGIREAPNGNVVASAAFGGSIDFGLGPIMANNGVSNLFLLQMNGM